MESGGRYSLTGWVNLPDRRGGAFKVEVVPMNPHGGKVGVTYSKGYFLSTGGWQSLRIDAPMPSGATQARVQLKVESFRGVAYVDQLSFARTP
ncbi:MAG: hypothetical protein ACYC66_00745 [Chloroflexota bacterium]